MPEYLDWKDLLIVALSKLGKVFFQRFNQKNKYSAEEENLKASENQSRELGRKLRQSLFELFLLHRKEPLGPAASYVLSQDEKVLGTSSRAYFHTVQNQ